MSESAVELLERGRQSQVAGDLAGAVQAFREAIELESLPLASLLLGGLYYADDRFGDARRAWETAFRGFREKGAARLE